MSFWDKIEQQISTSLARPFKLKKQSAMGGGSINKANLIEGFMDENGHEKKANFFIKINHKNRIEMFEAEATGLNAIANTQTIRVPYVLCSGIEGEQSYLLLEALPISAGDDDSASRLGQQLANLHKNTVEQFGWKQNNTIGVTRQINTPIDKGTDNWIRFWREQRLGYQFELAKQNGVASSLLNKAEKLLADLDRFFEGYEVEPSLLHGDLWSGNYAYLNNGEPVIYDPALYYGDRETDIAMTELFGGFTTEFYQSYNKTWPLDKGYKQRKNLYNLYHILNHYNMFGGGYAMQAENMLEQLLV